MRNSPATPPARYACPPFDQPACAPRIRWWIRTGAVLSVIGLVRLARAVRTRWPLLTGCALTAAGIMLRGNAAGVILLPGLVLLLSAPIMPASPKAERIRRSKLARELAAYATPAHRRDLERTLDRYPDGMTHELRDILASQAMTPGVRGLPGGRRY
ncbi:MAG TPA: hypothetical protein VGM53_14580 [Streptosporangiaceae bacterium]